MLRLIHAATLPYGIKAVFGDSPDKEQVKQLLSVLVAAKYVSRAGEEERYLVASDAMPFLDIPDVQDAIIASNLYLLKGHSALYKSIFGDSGVSKC